MSDYGEGEFEGDGPDWMYIEDYWDEANDLAEHTCPSPIVDFENLPEEYDVHDYWEDIEYISDGGYYEDYRAPVKRKQNPTVSRKPKKRRVQGSAGDSTTTRGPISWMTQAQRYQTQFSAPLINPGDAKSTALLKDWFQRFKDTPGLTEFTSSDTRTEETEEPVAGEGFDLGDLQSIAGLLSEENIGALQEIMKARGLDPAAVQEVLADMLEGKERSFDDEEDDDIVDESDGNDLAPGGHLEEQEDLASTQAARATGRGSSGIAEHRPTNVSPDHPGRNSRSRPQTSPAKRGTKRKGIVEGDSPDDDTGSGRVRRGKRQKETRHESNEENEKPDLSPNIPLKPSANARPSVRSRGSLSTPGPSEDDVPRTRSGRARRR